MQDTLAELLLVRLRRKELHYYNFIGNNDSLMNVLGCSPIMYGAVMCTAGILGLKKKKHEDCDDVFFVRTDNQNGWDEMVSRHCLADDVQRTPHKKSTFVRLGSSVNPRAADALHDDGWMAFDMVTVEQQFRLETPPPRLNLTKACNAFLKSVAPHVSVGGTCGDGLRNQQADVARGPEVPWWAQWPGRWGWDNDDDVGTVGTLTTTEAGEISEDDDDEDEDCVPCHEDEADVAREDATHEAHACSSALRRIVNVRSTVMASQRWELSMMPRMTMPLTSIS